MDGFQPVLQCFLDLQFGSAKFYDELLKISFKLFNTKYSQTNVHQVYSFNFKFLQELYLGFWLL